MRDLETVVDAVGLERFALLGMSQSCPVSIAYAVRHPERVSQLVLYGGYALGWAKRGPKEKERRKMASMIPGARFVPLESANHLLIESEPAWPRFLAEVRGFLVSCLQRRQRGPQDPGAGAGSFPARSVERCRARTTCSTPSQPFSWHKWMASCGPMLATSESASRLW